MKDLMLILGSVMPEEMIISQLKEALAEYDADPSKENRSKVSMHCALLLSKEASEQDPKGLNGMLDRAKQMDQAMDLLNPKKN